MSDPVERHEIAVEILVGNEAVAACRKHPEVMLDQGDNEALDHAIAIGTNKVRKAGVRSTIYAIIDAIESAYGNAAWNCRECGRNKG